MTRVSCVICQGQWGIICIATVTAGYLEQDHLMESILRWVLNLELFFSQTGCSIKAKEYDLPQQSISTPKCNFWYFHFPRHSSKSFGSASNAFLSVCQHSLFSREFVFEKKNRSCRKPNLDCRRANRTECDILVENLA